MDTYVHTRGKQLENRGDILAQRLSYGHGLNYKDMFFILNVVTIAIINHR